VEHHGAGLSRLLRHQPEDRISAELQALRTTPLQADVPAQDLALIGYALKLTESPGEMTQADVQKLRDQGLDDRAIHDACAITAYFAFVNRIADGLGVELEHGD
jgi:uncharacterized peroxidase-related enzyme